MCHERSRALHREDRNQDQDCSDTENGVVGNCKNVEKDSRNLRLVVLACFWDELTRNFSCDKKNMIIALV